MASALAFGPRLSREAGEGAGRPPSFLLDSHDLLGSLQTSGPGWSEMKELDPYVCGPARLDAGCHSKRLHFAHREPLDRWDHWTTGLTIADPSQI